ncbi:MAG TPA: hypothetical protein VHO90_10105, partial [Bacteroidales bacterium]|nr:hypothetical protein [Bacteroidales bacterium]
MHFKYLLTGVLLTIMAQLYAQQPGQSKLDYKQLWKEVEAFQEKGLPESALKIVDKIYAAAKSEKNSQQLVKSILYQLSLAESYQEDVLNKNVERLRREIESASFPVKPLLYSVLAETYWQYYENNRYRFRDRTETVNLQNNDLSTWSLEQLVDKTIESYLLSLENADKLKSVPIMQFEEVLIYGNKLGKDYRPTLYDFLAHRAVDLFMNNEPDIIKPAYSFSLNNADYFQDAAAFVKLPITTRDTFAYKYYALKLFQDLIQFHMRDQNPDALVDVELKRLEFINQYSTLPDKRELYLKALQSLDNKYKAYPISIMILLKIAQVWNEEAGLYNESQPNEHRMDKKKAYDICEVAIKRFPESSGAKQAYNLQQEIKMKNLEASVEKVNVPGLPFRALVTYKNFTQLYWRVLPVTPEEIMRERERWEKNYDVDQEQKLVEYLASKTPIKKGNITLPADSDFNQHSVEVKIDELSVGKYAILFSNNESFASKGNGIAYAFSTISNIAYYHRNRDDGSSDLFVVDRISGEPAAGAKVQVFLKIYNEDKRKYELVKDSIYKADDDGFVKLPYVYNQIK